MPSLTYSQVFLPTVLLTIFMPALTTILTSLAEKLTVLENYETQDCKRQANMIIVPSC